MVAIKYFLILWSFICLSRVYGLKAVLTSYTVTSDIKLRYARTMVSAEYYNDKNSPATADFNVILSDRAYISNFSMEMDGNVTFGVVREKEKAKIIFDRAVELGESAGLVSIKHRFTNKFDMTVNVEPNHKVIFNLTYEELLKRTNKKYTHRVFLPNGKVDKVLVQVFISDPQKIKIYDDRVHEERFVEHKDNNHVFIEFAPTLMEQEKLLKDGYDGEFIVEYDVERKDENLIYTLDGYFVHFFTPDDEPSWPMDIVFMIDVSGSMKSNSKLKQVQTAMHHILTTLEQHSTGNYSVATFNTAVNWQQREGHQQTMNFIKSLKASGATDINKALLAGLGKLQRDNQPNKAKILFFLTDGNPVSGVTDKALIRNNVKAANKNNAMIFTLGFGNDCDQQFLKDIAKENNGQGRKIYTDQESDKQIEWMFEEISRLVLKNVMITYLDNSIDSSYLTPTTFNTIFHGSEIAIAGRIRGAVDKSKGISSQITGKGPSGSWVKTKTLFFDIMDLTDIPKFPNLTRFEMIPNITKKTWAYVTLKNMIKNKASERDIVELAIEFGFVTPFTSMVVTKKQLRADVLEEGQNTYYDPMKPTTTVTVNKRPVTRSESGHSDRRESVALDLPPNRRESVALDLPPNRRLSVALDLPPIIDNINGVVVKPYGCGIRLCFKEKMVCKNTSKVLLLKDPQADVEIYSYAPRNEDCLKDFVKITIQTRRKKVELTSSFLQINGGRRIDIRKRMDVTLKIKNYLNLVIRFNRGISPSPMTIEFVVNDYMSNAVGLFSQYMKDYTCKRQSWQDITLSHTKRKFKKYGVSGYNFRECYVKND